MSEFEIVKSEYNALGEDNNYKTHYLKTSADQVVGLGRMKSFSYAVGDVVYTDNNMQVALKCTTAGTTSNTELDISNKNIGDTVIDGAVIWEVVSRSLPIATQAEAEAGTNNTTAMTPLGVSRRLDKDRIYKTYSSLSSLGIAQHTATINELVNALPVNSMVRFYASTNSASAEYFAPAPVPVPGIVTIIKGLNNVIPIEFELTAMNLDQKYIAKYSTSNNQGFTGWKKLATNGELSIPSNNYVAISANLNQLDYTAPADGWVASVFHQPIGTYAFFENYTKNGLLVAASTFTGYVDHKTIFVPVSKGDTFKIDRNGTTVVDYDRFYYAQSEV